MPLHLEESDYVNGKLADTISS